MSKEIAWIFGYNGFVGSKLAERLESEGIMVYNGTRNLIMPPHHPDYVYYLSSYGNYYDQTDIKEITKVNAENVDRLLFSLKKNPPKLFMYFSSSSVYGKHPHRLNEETSLDGETDYAKAKIFGELICRNYANTMPIVIVRPFTITGPGEQGRHLIPTAIRAAFSGEPLKLDPTPVHDYIDVYDLLNAVSLLTRIRKQIKGINIYNICSGKQYSNQEVVDLNQKVSGKKIKIKLTDSLRPYDSTHWLGDPGLLMWLGWHPHISLEQSIKDMIDIYCESGEPRAKTDNT